MVVKIEQEYDNYLNSSVCNHLIKLVKDLNITSGLHLHIGSEFSEFYECVKEQGLSYIEINIQDNNCISSKGAKDSNNVASIEIDRFAEQILELMGNQKLVSISFIGSLKYASNISHLLKGLRQVAEKFNAFLMVVTPNINHKNKFASLFSESNNFVDDKIIGAGNNIFLHASSSLEKFMRYHGWYEVNSFDVIDNSLVESFENEINHSEFKTFPSSYTINETYYNFINVSYFVRAYLYGPSQANFLPLLECDNKQPSVFLSIIMRTQGIRLKTLKDALLCLQAQTEQNFEILLVGHKLTIEREEKIHQILEEQEITFKNKIKFLVVNDKNSRAAPLNKALSIASGYYVSVLDDDDLVFANWIETFKKLALKGYGKVLRAEVVTQAIEKDDSSSQMDDFNFKTIGGVKINSPHYFDLIEHFDENRTPIMSFAFPRSLFSDFRFTFDEELVVYEDWDFLIRAVIFCGISFSSDIIAIYRAWENPLNCSRAHSQEERYRAINHLQKKIPYSFGGISPDFVKQILGVIEEKLWLKSEIDWARNSWIFGKLRKKYPWYISVKDTIKRKIMHINIIDKCRKSDLFDINWYLTNYHDVKSSGQDPIVHYVHYGVYEGRNPGPNFSTNYYFKRFPRVKRAKINPLVHYEWKRKKKA